MGGSDTSGPGAGPKLGMCSCEEMSRVVVSSLCGLLALPVSRSNWETAGPLLSTVPWGPAPVASHLQLLVVCTACLKGSAVWTLPAGLEELASCFMRQGSSRPTMSCVRLSVLLPCVPGSPIQQLSVLPSPQAWVSCRQQAAHEGILVYCQDLLFIHFHSGSFMICTRTLSMSSRAGHANTSISTVRHGEGQPDGNGFTVPLALWSQALQQAPMQTNRLPGQ